MAAEVVARFLWGMVAAMLVLLVVWGLLGRFFGVLRVLDPSTGAALPALLSLAGGGLGAWWRYSFPASDSGEDGA